MWHVRKLEAMIDDIDDYIIYFMLQLILLP